MTDYSKMPERMLDERIAECILGWERQLSVDLARGGTALDATFTYWHDRHQGIKRQVPPFTRDLTWAWEAMERIVRLPDGASERDHYRAALFQQSYKQSLIYHLPATQAARKICELVMTAWEKASEADSDG